MKTLTKSRALAVAGQTLAAATAKGGILLRRLAVEELGRPTYRKSNPIMAGTLYVFRQPQYDNYMVAPATAVNSQRLFSIPQGNATVFPGVTTYLKSLWDTSMDQQSLFPQPRKFFIRQFWLWIDPLAVLSDQRRFLMDTLVTLLISGRSFLTIHAHKIHCGGSLFGSSSAVLSNGLPYIEPGFQAWGDNGETIEQGQSVQVQIDPTQAHDAAGDTQPLTTAATGNPTNGVGLTAFFYLDGLLFREQL